MKVDVSWGRRNSKVTYHVGATDLGAALEFLKTLPEWGEFKGKCPAKWKTSARGAVTSVRLEPNSRIKMPSWPGYKKQPQECKNVWDDMYKALLKHEEGHAMLFEQLVKELAAKIEALETASETQIREILSSNETEMQQRSDKYDTDTDHGANQGVTLNITEACRSKSR